MAKPILMPQIGVSDESAILAEWHVKSGDTVEIGQLLFTIETDKSTFEVASDVKGTVLKLLCDAGDEVQVTAPVCIVGNPGDAMPDLSEFGSQSKPINTDAENITSTPAIQNSTTVIEQPDNKPISPRARATASMLGIDIALAVPTGAEGRIIERDILAVDIHEHSPLNQIEAVDHSSVSPSEFTDVPHSRIRKTIAKNMLNSIQNIPQLTHHHSFDASALLAMRKKCKESDNPSLTGITVGDLVLFAVSRILKSHPNLNAQYFEEHLRVFRDVNLGVAVDTPRGLMVPTIKGANKLSAALISAELKSLANECRTGSVNPSKLSGASFTVSNLGAYGVEVFTPIINPPQVAILGVCAVTNRIKADGSIYTSMGLSLTYDHRAVDGAPASAFMKELCSGLEQIDVLGLI